MKTWIDEDAEYIESRILDLEYDPRDLWQNRLIVGMLKVMFHILKWIKRQEAIKKFEQDMKKVDHCRDCFGASFNDCEDCQWK